MSVVGIDFGNLNAVIAVARNRGVDVICNEVSNRATPSLVSFGPKQRYLGESAKSQEIGNFKNTVGSLKRLIGRSMNERDVLAVEKKYVNCELIDVEGSIGARVTYQNEEQKFTFTQLVAMYMTKLKEITENELKTAVCDCVISIPVYFTDAQRRAMIDAAEIAGLNVLRLFHDTSASALQWGITKTDLPESEPKYVAFCDIGQSDYTVSIVGFQRGKMMVKGVAYERNLGGRDFDSLLCNYFVEEFKTKYKMDITTNAKAHFRLQAACERVKKVLSANAQSPINVECLMNDKDVSGIVERQTFEELAKPLLDRLQGPMEKALELAGVTKEQIDSVEVIGGTTRIPAVKQRIGEFFGKYISTTLNQDECVAKGCALMCAILSPVFQVREFKVEDVSAYPIKMSWESGETTGDIKQMVAFASYTPIPCTKLLTFYRRSAFEVIAAYSDPENSLPAGANAWIGNYTINNVKPDPQGEASTVKVKARLNPNGILEILGAQSVYEETVVVEEPPQDQAAAKQEVANGGGDTVANGEAADSAMETDQTVADENAAPTATPAPTAVAEEKKERKTKKVAKKTDLPVGTGTASVQKDKLLKLREQENAMAANDKLVFDTEERRNALEEYVYEMRGKVESDYAEFVVEADRESFLKKLGEMEDWLYGDGEDATKSVYSEKLAGLQKIGEPITHRYRQFEERPAAVESLRKSIQVWKDLAASVDPKYEHIPAEDRAKVTAECERKTEWLNKQLKLQDTKPKHVDPVVLVADLKREQSALDSLAAPIMNKPKPKPPKETTPKSTDATTSPTASAPGETERIDDPMAGVDSEESAAATAAPGEMDVD